MRYKTYVLGAMMVAVLVFLSSCSMLASVTRQEASETSDVAAEVSAPEPAQRESAAVPADPETVEPEPVDPEPAQPASSDHVPDEPDVPADAGEAMLGPEVVRSTIADWVASAVANEQSVNLMVIAPIEGIWATGDEFEGGSAPMEWRETQSRELVVSAVRAILAAYPGSEFVRVIDRSQVDLALDEAEFQATGLAGREDQLRLGAFIGATHVYTVEYSREMGRDLRRESRTTTLIELETGRVLAVDRWMTAAVRGDDGTWFEGRSLNGRQYETVDGRRVYVE